MLGRFIIKFRALAVFAVLSISATHVLADSSAKELLDAGRVDEVVPQLQQQIARSPQDAAANNFLCRAYFMMEEWDRGIAACERARNLDPQNSLYYLWLGRIYGEKADRVGFLSAAGLAKKVRTSFERAVELDPKSWEARSDLAEFYLEAPSIVGGGKDKAREQAEAMMPLNPGMGHWILARIAAKNKDLAEAERQYHMAIETTHSGARAWLDYAIFLRHANRLADMEQALDHLETSPVDRRESLMDGGSVLLHANRDYPYAAKLLRRYLEAPVEEGPSFRAYDLLGQVLEKLGDRTRAAEAYRAALALYHNYVKALEDLKRISR